MVANTNKVIVRPDADNLDFMGFRLERNHETVSVYGEVVGLPQDLFFSKRHGALSNYERRINATINDGGLLFDTDNELSIGDKVLFKYTAQLGKDPGKDIVLSYDDIYGVSEGGGIRPINGNIFVAVRRIGRTITNGEGIIRYVGAPVRAYRMSKYDEPHPDIKPGDTIFYQNGVPMEFHLHRKTEHLVSIHRKDILVICELPTHGRADGLGFKGQRSN